MCGPSFEALLHSAVVISALYTPSARYVVHPLYLHTINTRQPTMAVLHLTTGNVPFLQIDMQVRTRVSCATCAARVSCHVCHACHMCVQVRCFLALHRTNTLPSSEAMLTWLAEDAAWRASLQVIDIISTSAHLDYLLLISIPPDCSWRPDTGTSCRLELQTIHRFSRSRRRPIVS